jgi:G2/mitotic-specific cyclin 1/2
MKQTHNLEHYTTYSEADLLPTANIMLNYILEPVQHLSLYQKYAHKRHLKVHPPPTFYDHVAKLHIFHSVVRS